MPILHVRNVPPRLYADLKRLAREHRRSLSAEVIAALEKALDREARWARHLAALDRLRASREALGPLGTDSTAWIREDRDSRG